MSSCRVDKPSEIVDVGDKVWVKLIGKEVTLVLHFVGMEVEAAWGLHGLRITAELLNVHLGLVTLKTEY